MKDEIYAIVTRIYGNKEKWEQSRVRSIVHSAIRKFYGGRFYSTKVTGLQHEQYRRELVKVKPMNIVEKIIFLMKPFHLKLPMVECSTGMICTLKCKDCMQLNYLLKNKEYFNIDDVINDLDKLLNSIAYIYELSITGGEALGHPKLDQLIKFAISSDKVGCVVVVTNGTILPKESIIRAMHHPKVELSVSNYPLTNTKNREDLFKLCKKEGVRVRNNNEESLWRDFGPLQARNYSVEQKQEAFATCWMKEILAIIDGKVYRCEKTYVLNNLKVEKAKKYEYVDLRNDDTKSIAKEINKLYNLRHVNACNYCNTMSDRAVIPSGVQVEV